MVVYLYIGYKSYHRVLSIAALLLLVFLSSMPSIAFIAGETVLSRYLVKEINVIVRDEDGRPLSAARAYLYLIDDRGFKLVSETYTNSYGVAHFIVALPLKNYDVEPSASINLKIVAVKDNALAVYFFPVDPSNELLGPKNIEITAHSIDNRLGGGSSYAPSWEYVYNETYKLTPVLRFATYYGISARYEYPSGSKIRVQAKCRWPPQSSYPWYDCGYTEVTVDAGVGLIRPITGPKLYTLYFDIKYRYSMISLGAIAYEEVYAVDTSTDPRRTSSSIGYWDGHPITGSAYYDVPPGESRTINVTGGYNWDFSVSASFSYPWSVTVSLSVDKNPAPRGKLVYEVTGSYGSYARIVSLGDGDFLDTRAYWHD